MRVMAPASYEMPLHRSDADIRSSPAASVRDDDKLRGAQFQWRETLIGRQLPIERGQQFGAHPV